MNRTRILIFTSIFALVALILLGMILGSELIPMNAVWSGLLGENKYQFLIQEIRLPRVLTAVFSGAALGVGGLLMQSYFRNALAGPYILGISAGGGLGVSILMLAGGFLSFSISSLGNAAVLFSIIGSASTLALLLLISKRIGNGPMLLIAGLMIGSFASALVSILQFFAPSESIRKYLLWTMGSLTSVDLEELGLFALIIMAFLIISYLFSNPLNALLLGETQAKSLGIRIARVKWSLMIITGILAGIVTAFCGPIAFIGLTAPHLAKLILKTFDHHKLIPFSAILGAITLLGCDIIAQVPGFDLQLPINAVTSLIGAPIVVGILLSSKASIHG